MGCVLKETRKETEKERDGLEMPQAGMQTDTK